MNPDFINASIGGLLIGASSIVSLLLLGKITGISGIFWRALSNLKTMTSRDGQWQWLFLVGLLLGPLIAHHILHFPIPKPSESSIWLAIVAGLLVGFGSKLGSGCTSGHGICGIGRLSKRSIVATITFMFFGIVCVFLTNLIIGA